MTEIEVHYETAEGITGSVTVLLGDTYLSADEFTEEFLANHRGYTVVKIEEIA